MGNENQVKINNSFFNKLFFQFNDIRTKKINIEHFEDRNNIYYSQTSKIWFARGEDKNKYYYIFGSLDEEVILIKPTDYKLFIDFSKNEEICDDCIGILTKNNLYFHKNNFIKKYPNFNLKRFKVKNLMNPTQKNKQVEVIEIGSTNDFIYQLNTIFEEINPIKTVDENNLDDETIMHMNLFLNAIESEKPLEQSLKIARIDQKELDSWLNAAENKDERYIEFYEKYYKLIYTGKSKTANDNLMNTYYDMQNKNKTINFGDSLTKKTKIKMNVFINAYREEKNLKYALKLANLDKNLFYHWIEDGKNSNNKYHVFYKEYISIKEIPKVKVDTELASKNDELMEEFIRLKHEGKTNKKIYETLNIPRYLIKNWRNQGQMGNKKYKEFYEAYILDNNPKPEIKAEKKEHVKTTTNKIEENKRKCKICGRGLHERHQGDLCKRCLKKQYAVKILGEILSVVEPGVSFRKDDLEILEISKIRIKDYIWTLKEFDLIIEDKSKIILKDMNTLNNFAEECESTIEIQENINKKLSKTCKTCGETLEISNFFRTEDSEDGYEDNCMKCKKLINSAVFLKELINYVDWESEFSLDDIKSNFQDPIILQGNIWNLAENDLVVMNHETNNYKLTDNEKGEEFIKKYYQKPKTIKKSTAVESPKKEEHKIPKSNLKLQKEEQMEIVLDKLSRRKSKKEAAILAKIPLYKITHWCNEGRQGFGNENINFYKKLKKIELQIKPYSIHETEKQINNFLKSFNETKDKKLAAKNANLHIEDIDDWIILGEKEIKPYYSFIIKFNQIKNNIDDNPDVKEFNIPINTTKRKIFLEYIRIGSSIEKACEQASIDKKIIMMWLDKGNDDIYPFNEFYNKYKKLIENQNTPDSIEEDYTKNIENKKYNDEFIKIENKSKRDLILKEIKLGKSDEEACKHVKLDMDLFKNWIVLGKKNKKPFNDFYNEYNEIKLMDYNIKEYNNIKNETKRRNFIVYLKKGIPIDEALEQAALEQKLVNKWLDLGEEKIMPFDDFYNNYTKYFENTFSKEKRNEFLEYIKQGYSKAEASQKLSLDINLVNEWIMEGKSGKKPYHQFLNSYKESKQKSKDNEEVKIKNDIINLIKNGLSLEEAAKEYEHGFYENKILDWYEYGKYNDSKYIDFYEKVNQNTLDFFDLIKKGYSIKIACEKSNLNYAKVKDKIANQDEEFLNKLIEAKILNKINEYPSIKSSQDNEKITELMNEIIKLKIKGKSTEKICKIVELPSETYSYWMDRGKRNFGHVYTDFYNTINKINKLRNDIKTSLFDSFTLPNILDKLPDEYNNFISESDTGFAWVKKTGALWVYTRESNGNIFNYSSGDIRELFKTVIENNQIWGVRDYNKAKNSLKNPIINKNIPEVIEDENKDEILNPLSDEIINKLKENNETFESGFAWVKKINNYWIYSKTINSQPIKIINENIFQLHEQVIKQNLDWGVCNLNNAVSSLDNTQIQSEENYENILKPLPEDIEKILRKHSKGNKTGFAWVNKIGDDWIYARKINNNYIKLTDQNIYELYEKVINNDYEWGVRDLKKAKKSLEDEEKPKINKIEKINIEEYDILAPLPEEYELSFKSTKINKSGFAWVNKNGNQWQYAGNINGKHVQIKDKDIYNLHKKVISQRLVWGVRDLIKAKETLKNEKKLGENVITGNLNNDAKISINYLSRTESNVNILIKGTIPDDELLSVLTELKLFEKYIIHILSNKINSEFNILIELNLEIELLSKFEEKINNLEWIRN